ncbi:histidine kinase [Mycolicibacterium novocastrense]|uniref:histidine kinase n=1 Tax=Mycolicibacterium novocastrense TaxID=59813 RepID=A0AAW5SEU9_MYCNV|nr:HAMP domain-containing sensor histidine kinase [Mycolicibacterium novocastrense]KUH73820.1 histidine kinase [Mycolicibacterium novocastrense]KUH74611.1 histidine kinase [Mycolicibacterium novocastrense]KUH75661.1 histidine kinase [Mycolicibacterium novocastrense]MCV7021831.1 HAMP domain-containing histidine kinase [Mycolicibacterium novocastrense]GAT11737.1 two component sensor kinase [Mycolicibacterium novocastrense]
MSSSPRADGPVAGPSTRIRSARTWSLRARLLASQVVLLALVCAAVGVGTVLALQHFLTDQLDERLLETGRRSAGLFEFGPPPPPPGFPRPGFRERMIFRQDSGPGPAFLNAPGQAARTLGAVISHGEPVDAGVITADGTRSEISVAAAQQLARVAQGSPATVDLDGLGRYRVLALSVHRPGEAIVTGLPLSDVDDTLLTVAVIFGAVGAVALVGATTAGFLIIRRQLAPLARVSDAARQVADLELERGEVRLPTPIVRVDPAGAHTEIGQLGSALNRMLDRIASALSARHASETRIRQFVADASHELRTPLAAIRGYTELAQRKRGDVPDDVAHAMSRVESETARMTQLVEDMLLLARLDTGRPLERESVDLSRLIVDAVSDAHIAGPEHQWALDLPEEPVVVPGDEARLHQVLANLLANARTHTPPGTSVTTSLTVEADGRAVLTVADDGPGIPVWLQPEIFERFARGDSSRSRREGSTGLGLAIVAAVVKAHRGTIDVHSTPGDTRFVVTFPGDSQLAHSGGNTGT